MPDNKKVCPLLSALMPLTEAGGKHGFSCLGDTCGWWVKVKDESGTNFGMYALVALVSVRVVP